MAYKFNIITLSSCHGPLNYGWAHHLCSGRLAGDGCVIKKLATELDRPVAGAVCWRAVPPRSPLQTASQPCPMPSAAHMPLPPWLCTGDIAQWKLEHRSTFPWIQYFSFEGSGGGRGLEKQLVLGWKRPTWWEIPYSLGNEWMRKISVLLTLDTGFSQISHIFLHKTKLGLLWLAYV